MKCKYLIHRIIRKIIHLYKLTEQKIYYESVNAKDTSVIIGYPSILGHPELIDIGCNTQILSYSRIQLYPELLKTKKTFHVTIGNDCFFGYRLCILAGDQITIGNHVLIASDVLIISHNHGIDPESNIPYMDQELTASSVLIGDNCWIGDKVVILPGVRIGNGTIIGAGSIVTHDIPDYSVAVGNPARVVKKYNKEMHLWKPEKRP